MKKRMLEAEKPTIHPNEIMLVKLSGPSGKKVADTPILEDLAFGVEMLAIEDHKLGRKYSEALTDQYRRQTEVLLHG